MLMHESEIDRGLGAGAAISKHVAGGQGLLSAGHGAVTNTDDKLILHFILE